MFIAGAVLCFVGLILTAIFGVMGLGLAGLAGS